MPCCPICEDDVEKCSCLIDLASDALECIAKASYDAFENEVLSSLAQ